MKHLETERSAPLSSKSGRRYTTTTIKTFAAVALAAAALTTIDATGNAFAYGRLAGVVQVPNLTKNSGLTGLIPVPKALPNPSPCRRFRSTNRIPSDTARGSITSATATTTTVASATTAAATSIKRHWTIVKVCPDYD
jgi:hypothetical protein